MYINKTKKGSNLFSHRNKNWIGEVSEFIWASGSDRGS